MVEGEDKLKGNAQGKLRAKSKKVGTMKIDRF